MNKTSVFVFDIDGTIANAEHRIHHLRNNGEKKDWKSFFEKMGEDPPFSPMIALINAIESSNSKENNHVVLQTGRPEKYRYQTGKWIADVGLRNSYELLLMRQERDMRDNVSVKMSFLDFLMDHYNVDESSFLWFEDSVRVVKALNKVRVLTLSCEHFLSVPLLDENHPEIPFSA